MVSKKKLAIGGVAVVVVGGKTTAYDLKEGGVGITTKNLNDSEKKATDKAKQDIEGGKIKVPNHPAGSDYNQQF